MNYRNMPEALLYSHMTSEVHLKDLLTGKLPYYWYTTVIYAQSERQANKWKSDLGCVSGWEKYFSTCFYVQIQRKQSIAQCLSALEHSCLKLNSPPGQDWVMLKKENLSIWNATTTAIKLPSSVRPQQVIWMVMLILGSVSHVCRQI